jgi:N-acetylmuramoyl-L-alanine amidase
VSRRKLSTHRLNCSKLTPLGRFSEILIGTLLACTPLLTGGFLFAQSQLATACRCLPPIPVRSAVARNFGTRRPGTQVEFIVLHAMDGTLPGTLATFQNPIYERSAHYLVGSDGAITSAVPEDARAFHAREFNNVSIGIELEDGKDGHVENARWATDAIYESTARLVACIANRHNIPLDRQHILGHSEVPKEHKSDVGQYWDWPRFMRLVIQASGACSAAN